MKVLNVKAHKVNLEDPAPRSSFDRAFSLRGWTRRREPAKGAGPEDPAERWRQLARLPRPGNCSRSLSFFAVCFLSTRYAADSRSPAIESEVISP